MAPAIRAPNTVNGVHESTVVRASAAIAGPISVAAPSSHPSATFAAASSRGPRTYAGISVATTGRVVVTAQVEMTAPAYASTCGAPVASAIAIANIAADCTSRPVVRTSRAPRRSDQPPTNAATNAAGSSCATSTAVASRTPPKPNATVVIEIHTPNSAARNAPNTASSRPTPGARIVLKIAAMTRGSVRGAAVRCLGAPLSASRRVA